MASRGISTEPRSIPSSIFSNRLTKTIISPRPRRPPARWFNTLSGVTPTTLCTSSPANKTNPRIRINPATTTSTSADDTTDRNGQHTSGTSDKGGAQGTPAPAPGDTGKDKGDEGSQPSSGGNIPTKPATTTSTSTDDTTDRNGQLTSGKGALPKTGETTERPAFGFLGVIVVILMGVLGLKRKQREE